MAIEHLLDFCCCRRRPTDCLSSTTQPVRTTAFNHSIHGVKADTAIQLTPSATCPSKSWDRFGEVCTCQSVKSAKPHAGDGVDRRLRRRLPGLWARSEAFGAPNLRLQLWCAPQFSRCALRLGIWSSAAAASAATAGERRLRWLWGLERLEQGAHGAFGRG